MIEEGRPTWFDGSKLKRLHEPGGALEITHTMNQGGALEIIHTKRGFRGIVPLKLYETMPRARRNRAEQSSADGFL
jgi:hypothetical protein